jgi:hypothetical protein
MLDIVKTIATNMIEADVVTNVSRGCREDNVCDWFESMELMN